LPGVFIAVVLTFIFLGRPRWSFYPVQELLIFLLGIAILLASLAIIVNAVLLLWQGIKLARVRLKAVFGRTARGHERQLHTGPAIHRQF